MLNIVYFCAFLKSDYCYGLDQEWVQRWVLWKVPGTVEPYTHEWVNLLNIMNALLGGEPH